MFTEAVTLRGQEATVVWGYRTAAVCKSWTAYRTPHGAWSLRAVLQRSDPFVLRQQPLQFTAPRVGGYFCFPVVRVNAIGQSLTAQLGPPVS